jgi:hypothetical protein
MTRIRRLFVHILRVCDWEANELNRFGGVLEEVADHGDFDFGAVGEVDGSVEGGGFNDLEAVEVHVEAGFAGDVSDEDVKSIKDVTLERVQRECSLTSCRNQSEV